MGINLSNETDESTCQYLKALYDYTGGDPTAQVSMYEIGEQLGLDKDAAAREAEKVMAEGWVEVRTLSGAIGLTLGGIDAVKAMGGGADDEKIPGLGSGLILEKEAHQGVEMVVAGLKARIEEAGLGFDDFSELIADLRTVDAQLASPRPKTAILRACFQSIRTLVDSAGLTESLPRIDNLLSR